MRKPFEIGDKIFSTAPKSTGFVHTIVGKSVDGVWLIQRRGTDPVLYMADIPHWEHYIEPKVGYVNIFEGGTGILFSTRERADRATCMNRIACVKITYKEGQFDD